MVSFELLARPALRHMQGDPDPLPHEVPAVADADMRRHPDGKVHYARVAAAMGEDGRYHARLSGGQGSHMLWSMARADALAVLPDGDGVEAGGTVGVLLL
jgi:molybdopterin biosynthesis enzyme